MRTYFEKHFVNVFRIPKLKFGDNEINTDKSAYTYIYVFYYLKICRSANVKICFSNLMLFYKIRLFSAHQLQNRTSHTIIDIREPPHTKCYYNCIRRTSKDSNARLDAKPSRLHFLRKCFTYITSNNIRSLHSKNKQDRR